MTFLLVASAQIAAGREAFWGLYPKEHREDESEKPVCWLACSICFCKDRELLGWRDAVRVGRKALQSQGHAGDGCCTAGDAARGLQTGGVAPYGGGAEPPLGAIWAPWNCPCSVVSAKAAAEPKALGVQTSVWLCQLPWGCWGPCPPGLPRKQRRGAPVCAGKLC